MITSVGLFVRGDSERVLTCAAKAEAFFRKRGILTAYLSGSDPVSFTPEIILTFGGDGTLLAGKEAAIRYHAPLFGINLGTVGFLTEGDPENLEEILLSLTEGNFGTESRRLLQVSVSGREETWLALNDAVLTRGGFARLIRVDTMINSERFATFTADGVIVATPTGSTGYSLSAGGPVVSPEVRCMILTPVCPHSLQHCPCVVPDGAAIRVRLEGSREQSAELQIDGRRVLRLSAGDEITVTGSGEELRLIRLKPYRFFTLTRQKLSEWGS